MQLTGLKSWTLRPVTKQASLRPSSILPVCWLEKAQHQVPRAHGQINELGSHSQGLQTNGHPYTTSSKLTGDMSSSLQGCAEQGTKISILMTGIQSLSSLGVFQMLQHEETSPSYVSAKDWHSPIAVGASLTAKILPLNCQHLSSSAYLLCISGGCCMQSEPRLLSKSDLTLSSEQKEETQILEQHLRQH